MNDGSHLNSAVDFLRQTSTMIAVFRDRRPIKDKDDSRLHDLSKVLVWFKSWESEQKSKPTATKSLPSDQCLMDVKSMLYTFEDVCRTHLDDFPEGEVIPSRFNSDPVENHFCQTRGLHGGNLTNPTYQQYASTVNSIILGQSLRSRGRKSNAQIAPAMPYNMYTKNPVRRSGQTKLLRL